MLHDELRESLRSVSFTTVTPFSDDGTRVLHEQLAENVRTLYDEGARVFIPCGNTGEYYSLAQQERVDVVRTTVEALPDDATVIGGAGGSTQNALELLTAYEAAGADAAMVMYPRHTYVHERGLIDYYRTLTEETDLGLVLYKRGPLLSETVLEELATIDAPTSPMLLPNTSEYRVLTTDRAEPIALRSPKGNDVTPSGELASISLQT